MKRSVSLLLVVVLFAFGVMPVSASASGAPDGYINVFDYSSGFDGFTDNFIPMVSGSRNAYIELPFLYQVGFVDMVVSAPSRPTVTLLSGYNKSMTVEHIYNAYYRVSCKVWGNAVHGLEFLFESAGSYVSVKSLIVSPMVSDPVPEVGTVNGVWANGNTNSATMSSPTSPATIRSPFAGNAQHVASGSFTFYSRNWVKHDFVDYYFQISNVYSLSSIEVSFNEQAIPFEVSVVSGSSNVNTLVYTVHVVADCRGLDRTGVQFPIVTVNASTSGDTWVRLLNVTGSSVADAPNPVVIWFDRLITNLKQWFTDLQYSVVTGFNNLQASMKASFDKLIAVLTPDKKPGEDFGSTVESQAGQLGEAGDILNSVTRPPVQDFDVQIDSFVNPADVTFLGGVVRPFMENKIVLTLLLMSLTLATLGYVLYGKR